MTRKIRGITRRIITKDAVYEPESLDDQDIAKRRILASRYISRKVDAYTIRGDIADVRRAITELIGQMSE
jgi:hypothetical protein